MNEAIEAFYDEKNKDMTCGEFVKKYPRRTENHPAETCKWKWDKRDQVWEPKCSSSDFVLSKRNFIFCPFCGKKMEVDEMTQESYCQSKLPMFEDKGVIEMITNQNRPRQVDSPDDPLMAANDIIVPSSNEINRRFAELVGIPFKEGYESFDFYTKGEWIPDYPDFCADPRLVLEAMMKRADFYDFIRKVGFGSSLDAYWYVYGHFIMDITGKLALAAIAWMER